MTRALHVLFVVLTCLSPVAASANWAQIRQMVHQADQLTDRDKREAMLRKAYAEARESVRRAPRVSNEYLWLANAAGRLAQTVGTREKLQLAKVVKENAELAISLDPNNGPAHMTLGAWHFYVANVSWVEKNMAKALFGDLPKASYETAIAHLTKALARGVDNPLEVLWLRGRAHEEKGDEAKAMADYRACVAGTARNAAEQRFQNRAKKELS